jgi:hypothetical protein
MTTRRKACALAAVAMTAFARNLPWLHIDGYALLGANSTSAKRKYRFGMEPR